MRAIARSLIPLLAVAPLAATAAAQELTAELKLEPRKRFDLVLPSESWIAANGILIPHRNGRSFATEKDGVRMRVDTDGDGEVDEKIQGARGFALLRGEREDGTEFAYAVRFRQSGTSYEYSTSCVMTGSLDGVSIDLVDLDNDGTFNEVGVDGMIVGGGKVASYLSEVVDLNGTLHTIEVDPSGTSIRAVPYEGPTGTLRIRGGLELPGKLLSAVVTDASRRYSFQVGHTSEVTVPAGTYRLSGGFAEAGGDTARLRAGDMAPLVVEDGGTATFERWGAPLVAEFDFTRAGDIVTVQPNVRFIGRGGEEWYQLLPDAKSPKLVFIDADSNRVLDSKRFEGC